MIGYLVAYGCGVLSTVIVWQFVSWRRETAEYRAEEEAYQKRAAARRAAMSPLDLYRSSGKEPTGRTVDILMEAERGRRRRELGDPMDGQISMHVKPIDEA